MTFCAGCEEAIVDKQYLLAIERCWHEGCLKCACCQCRLAEFGDHFYARAGLTLCARDYVRLFGVPGHCVLCSREIAPSDWVMTIGQEQEPANEEQRQIVVLDDQEKQQRQRKRVFTHLDCFACSKCNVRFCVGELFTFRNGQILCQKDFMDEKDANVVVNANDNNDAQRHHMVVNDDDGKEEGDNNQQQ